MEWVAMEWATSASHSREEEFTCPGKAFCGRTSFYLKMNIPIAEFGGSPRTAHFQMKALLLKLNYSVDCSPGWCNLTGLLQVWTGTQPCLPGGNTYRSSWIFPLVIAQTLAWTKENLTIWNFPSHFAAPLLYDSLCWNWGSETWDRIGLLNQEKAPRRGTDGERGITCSFSSSEYEKSKIPFSLQKPQYKQDFPRGNFCMLF